jgi:hypothetical protein
MLNTLTQVLAEGKGETARDRQKEALLSSSLALMVKEQWSSQEGCAGRTTVFHFLFLIPISRISEGDKTHPLCLVKKADLKVCTTLFKIPRGPLYKRGRSQRQSYRRREQSVK